MSTDIFQVLQQRKAKISQGYNEKYWNSAFSGYTNVRGRINWDAKNNNISYSEPTKSLPTLNAMWGDYLNGAKSRGVKADFLTFKKMYDGLKLEKQRGLVSTLSQAKLSGIPLNKIHELMRNEPGLSSELIKTIANSTDENVRAALSEYVAPQQTSLGQTVRNNPGLIGAGVLGGTAAAGYALAPNAPLSSYDIGDRLEKMGATPKKPSYYDPKLKKWIGPTPKEYTAANNDINAHVKKRPIRSKYKTDANFNKANKAHQTITNDLMSKREQVLKTANAKYKVDKVAYKSGIAGLNKDIRGGDQTRLSKFLGGKKMGVGTGLALAFGAPMITGQIAKSMGVDEKGVGQIQMATNGLVAAGYSAPIINKAMTAVKALPPGITNAAKMAKFFGTKGMTGALLSAAIFMGISMIGSNVTSNQKPTVNQKKESLPDFYM